MSASPKSSRMEKQVRNQARGLFFVSALLLVACATMTGLFGWSLGRSLVERVVFAMGLVGSDLAGAYLMATSGTCSANKEVGAAWGAVAAALVCCLLTFSGIIGFQSESREAQVASREQAAKIADDFLGWSKSIAVDAMQSQGKEKDKGASTSKTMTAGIEAVGKAVNDQMAKLNSGEMAAVGDGQATTISRVTGWSEAKTRSWTITATSATLLFIQYACLWFYGFLRHRIEPAVRSQNHGPAWAEKGRRSHDSVGDSVVGVSREMAKFDVQQQIAASVELSNEEYASRWGVAESKASRWLTQFQREGVLRRVPRGRRKVAIAPSSANLKLVGS